MFTCTVEIILGLTCEDDGGVSSRPRSRLWVCMQQVLISRGTRAARAGGRLAGPHLLRSHNAGGSGRELAGHPCGHQTPADEDGHQLLHR